MKERSSSVQMERPKGERQDQLIVRQAQEERGALTGKKKEIRKWSGAIALYNAEEQRGRGKKEACTIS